MPDPTPTTDRWNDRDLPLLRAIVEQLDASLDTDEDWVTGMSAGRSIGMDDDDTRRGVAALLRGGLIEIVSGNMRFGDGAADLPVDVGREAYELAGLWPVPGTAADRLLDALQDLADNGPDEPTRSKAKVARSQLGTLGRDTLASVVATVLTGQLPGAGS